MADKGFPTSLIQNAFAAGEIAPDLYGRTDLAKYHQGAMVMRNWFVNYKGGVSTRPGTQYIGAPASGGYARLIPFVFSPEIGQTYMLVFSAGKIRFIKNPGGNSYPNSSNAGLILSGGVPYEISTPYVEADLPYLKFSQVADKMRITRHGYTRKILSRITDTNWTLTDVSSTPAINSPTVNSITITALPTGSSDPAKTRYMYCVTAVDADGNESLPSVPLVSGAGLNVATTIGTVSVFWSPVDGAVWYKVYKALPTSGDKVPAFSEQFGFAGYAYGTTFTDSNVVPDFTKAPPMAGDPFQNGKINGYTISASSSDWPVGSTTLTVTDANGTGAVLYPILDNNTAAGTGAIVGIYIANPGSGYTAPTVTASGGGTTFTAALTLSAASGNDPDVVGLFQQRIIYASSTNFPNSIFAGRVGGEDDFRVSNPVTEGDAFTFTIASAQVNDIMWLQPMPGGLVVGTNSGVVQLTGGSSSAANPAAVTALSAVIVPQSYYGCSDIDPIVIDYDILYIQAEGSIVRDLQYNFFVNIYTGTDITSLSSHLFYPHYITSWTYQDTPTKVIWAVNEGGGLLSCTFLKAQEVIGWARHDTGANLVESVATVREGVTDAVYMVVNRAGSRCIERLCDRIYEQVDNAWCLDSALSTQPTFPAASVTFTPGATGFVTATASAPIFAAGDVGKVVRAQSGKGTITAFISTTQVTISVDYTFNLNVAIPETFWRMDAKVSVVSGLFHLANGRTVYALADGVVQGPLVIDGGAVALTSPASQVVVGIAIEAQLQTLYLDVGGEQTIQGKRDKIVAASFRVKDSVGLKYGNSFSTTKLFTRGISSIDAAEATPSPIPGLETGDQRVILNEQVFGTLTTLCIEASPGLPGTILAVIPEVTVGDNEGSDR